jgi:hypothetical protein
VGAWDREKDPAQVAEAIKRWAQWNTDNKEMPIAITAAQVARRVKELQSSREQRFIKSTPRELRGQVAQDLRHCSSRPSCNPSAEQRPTCSR